ncbi:HprK-related kinase A [Pseudothauera nasutitermitis]|uniref:HprK-related kinase A n=1 Tax=Pseudothauera nasutitermitis TaxID=2565930 RepID=UPI001454C5D6|nr:HprK-related kinase A [Pseudothauera nasutitermitis]
MTAQPFAPLASFAPAPLRRLLAEGRLALRSGPLTVRITSSEAIVARNLALLYRQHPAADAPPFADFHVQIARPAGPRRWLRPQVEFRLDGHAPFLSLPAAQAFALLEWGMNWCIASHCHQYLVLHAAVLARGEDAVLLPAPPGAGKSTLCAFLAHRGWRLLSDELALLEPGSARVWGLARPINVKNASIGLLRTALPEAVFADAVPDTKKGTVAHIAPPPESVAEAALPARLRWIVTPRYQAGAPLSATPIGRPEAMAMLIDNAFNYDVLGEQAFVTLTDLLADVPCVDLHYARLEDAQGWFEALGR